MLLVLLQDGCYPIDPIPWSYGEWIEGVWSVV